MARAHGPTQGARHLVAEARTEIELKLAAHDAAVLDELAERTELAGYMLRPAPSHVILDCYWDSRGCDLDARKCSLRLREQDGIQKLTLKQSGSISGGLFQQPELELPATPESWATIRAELLNVGLGLPLTRARQPDPRKWLAAAGLEMTQERTTARRILVAERDGSRLVELALDTTTYQLGLYEVVFREIEAEALGDQLDHVLALGAALRRAFPGRLSPSDRNKYLRGLELARRLGGL
jgi:hypothetical protein